MPNSAATHADKVSAPTASSIGEWGKRVSDARARLTGEMLVSLGRSRIVREGSEVLTELTLAFEELQVAEEELRAQTEELAASRELLDTERARYRALFEHAPVPYIVTDTNGSIGGANDAAARLFRVSRDRLYGKPLAVFVPPSRRRAFRTQLTDLAACELMSDVHLELRRRGGGVRSVSGSVGVVRDRDRNAIELRWLLVDDTARRRREHRTRSMNLELTERVEQRTKELTRAIAAQETLARAADAARQNAERASREKSQLIAMVSHELRTPLAAISGYAELLMLDIRGPLTPPQRADIARMQEAQAHILRLVDDLVGYEKLESGRLTFEIADVIVPDALYALLTLIRPQAASKDITVSIAPGSNEAVVAADEERLRQIVLNLLSNALKFTAQGGHVVLAWDMDEHDVIITIQDDGIGIPADKLEAVFEPYVQLDSSAVGQRTGWGLGLGISRDLARAMGGDLAASGSPGDGALFTLKLPRSTRVAPVLSDS